MGRKSIMIVFWVTFEVIHPSNNTFYEIHPVSISAFLLGWNFPKQ